MTVVSVNFNKLLVERKANVTGKISINNNVSIKEVEESDLSVGQVKEKALKCTFEYTSKYEPNVADIQITGFVVYLTSDTKNLMKEWKKSKKLPKEVMANLINSILMKCNIEAILLSREANLPSPIPLPKVKVEQSDNYIG